MPTGKRILYSLLILSCSLLFFMYRHVNLPLIDAKTDHYFETISKKSISAYAVTRGINAIVSVIKESHLSVSPAGLGITVAAGQILDPLDDLTEKLSSVLILSIVSIGVQKIAMEIGNHFSFQAIAFLLPFLILPIWIKTGYIQILITVIAKLILILFILRLFLPASMFVNGFFYTEFMEENITDAKSRLKLISENGGTISNFDTFTTNEGILDTLNNSLDNMTLKMNQMKRLFNTIKHNLGDIITSLLDLTIYYSMIFLVQIILIPITVLWLTVKSVRVLFRSEWSTGLLNKAGLKT